MCKENRIEYVCNRCKKSLGNNKDILFIAESGEYLCNNCCIGVEPVSQEVLNRINDYIRNRNKSDR